MQRWRAVLVMSAVVLIGASCARDVDSPAAGSTTVAAAAVDCDEATYAAFEAWADTGFSGSIAMSTGGELDCVAGFGFADEVAGILNTPETVFSLGSVSKAFTAAAIFGLVDEGQLRLDDRVGDLVPDLGGPAADATVEQLLLHTSGLTGGHGQDHEPLDRDEAVAAIGRLERASEPGAAYLYSNAGYTLLAVLVEAVSGAPYREHVAEHVLATPDDDSVGGFWDGEPAAPGPRAIGVLDDGTIGETGGFAGPHWALQGNGDLAMTMPELASWTYALFEGQIVSPDSVEALSRPAVDQGEGRAEAPGWLALDASVFGERVLAAAGGGGSVGHGVVVAWLPESERVIALASNTPDVTAEALIQIVAPALIAGEPLPRPDERERTVDPVELAAAEGTYVLDSGGTFGVAATDEGLVVTADGPDAVATLLPPSDAFGPAEVERHEDDVRALLAGETAEGREEIEALESDLGPIEGVQLAGTIEADGELRTYVVLAAEEGPAWAWYALDDQGGIAAVELTEGPPTVELVADGSGGYRPDDPTGRGADVTVSFAEGTMTIAGPGGTIDVRAAG
jgi:CubicO group peptidase (beta-lactamase class C family)